MVQDKIKTLADNYCLAMCYLELWGIHDDGDKLDDVRKLMNAEA